MQRLIIGSAIAVTLAAGVLLFRPTMDSTEARSGLSAAPTRKDSPLRACTADRPFTESHRKVPPPAVASRFEKQSIEIAAMPRATERENAIRELAHEWAAEDRVAAEQWAAAFDDPEDWERAMTHVCLEVAVRNPREAIEIAQGHELNPGTVESIAGQWAKSDFNAAADWVRESPAGELRDNALARLALVRAETSPVEAASMVSTSLAAGPAQEEAAIAVLYQWLRQDPEAASQWVDVFPDGKLKERARGEIQGMAAHRAALQAAQ